MKKQYYTEIGKEYGKWTVLDNHIKYIKPSGAITYLNLCRCECGKESLRESITLFKSTLKGCFSCCKKGREPWNKGKEGCFSKEVIEKIKNTQKGKHNSPRTEFKKGMIPWNKDGKMPQITGEKNYKWREDREQIELNKKRLYLKENIEWRNEVFKRDKWKCKINDLYCCGQLEAHHILGWRSYPESRFDINNGITLCHAHHPRKVAEEKRLIPTFQELVSVSKEILS